MGTTVKPVRGLLLTFSRENATTEYFGCPEHGKMQGKYCQECGEPLSMVSVDPEEDFVDELSELLEFNSDLCVSRDENPLKLFVFKCDDSDFDYEDSNVQVFTNPSDIDVKVRGIVEKFTNRSYTAEQAAGVYYSF